MGQIPRDTIDKLHLLGMSLSANRGCLAHVNGLFELEAIGIRCRCEQLQGNNTILYWRRARLFYRNRKYLVKSNLSGNSLIWNILCRMMIIKSSMEIELHSFQLCATTACKIFSHAFEVNSAHLIFNPCENVFDMVI